MHKFDKTKETMIMKHLLSKNKKIVNFWSVFCVFCIIFATFLQFRDVQFLSGYADFEDLTVSPSANFEGLTVSPCVAFEDLKAQNGTNFENLTVSSCADFKGLDVMPCEADVQYLRVKGVDENCDVDFLLTIRQGARKYVSDENGVNLDRLAAFLNECAKRLIMPEYALKFVFDNFDDLIFKLEETFNLDAENATLSTLSNSGTCFLKTAKNGLQLDKNAQIFNIFYNLAQKRVAFDVCKRVCAPSINDSQLAGCLNLRGGFFTTYASSSAERKSNIELALNKFDGLVLDDGEVLSFNETTGRRTPENGYKSAKIITNGNFVEGNGGGVCQASTTLYNAALIAGLDIVEANQHSLKVGYVAPSFDAMVNFGSSDLKIRNNTGRPVMFATKCDGNTCRVNVFGIENPYKIVRRSEVVSEIEPLPDKFVNAKDVPELENTLVEKSYYLHYPKKGLKSEGFLEYWQNDNLVATKKIRTNTYAPVTGVVVLANTDHNLPIDSNFNAENGEVNNIFAPEKTFCEGFEGNDNSIN